MEPALYRLGLKPREVDRVLREETVADVQAMVDGSTWHLAWQTTQLMNSTGNYKPQIEVGQLRSWLMRDLMAPPEEREDMPEVVEPEPQVDPERAERARAALDEALARRAVLDREKAGGVTIDHAAASSAEPDTTKT